MLRKIIVKNFKNNIQNYSLFFVSNIIAAAELFAFWGINDIVKEAITDEVTAATLQYDFWIATGLVTFITTFLMVFSMRYYIQLRAKDYSIFITLGMRKKMTYMLILAEYTLGWLFSFAIGMLAGHGILYGCQKALKRFYSDFVEITDVRFVVYRNTILLSLGIMAAVFLLMMMWIDGRDLSTLMLKEEKEKKPESIYWSVAVVIGVGIMIFAGYQFQGGSFSYMVSHIEWLVGGLLILAFGGGVLLGRLRKRRKFYLRNILSLNQLYSKYQSNLIIVFILFTVHFFSLTYIVAEVASILPLDKYKEGYPYDMIWMAQVKDTEFSEELIEEYGGTKREIPMVRVRTNYTPGHIGISESSYEELTGQSYDLKGREIIVNIESQEEQKEEIADDTYWDVYSWLYIGCQAEELFSLDFRALDDPQYLYEIQDIYTQRVIGQYSIDQWRENIIVFSDDYFNEQWERLSGDAEEPSLLMLFNFPEESKEGAWKELEEYAEQYGVQEPEITVPQSVVYSTDEFLVTQKMRQLFSFSSKMFLLCSMLVSSVFVTAIKIISDIPAYQRKYEFLYCMGMRTKSQKKNMKMEMQNVANIALIAGMCMAVIYAASFSYRAHRIGAALDWGFWKYWLLIVIGYILIEIIIQRILVQYIMRKIEKENRK